MRHVFVNTEMVVHVWAARSQDHGRNPAKNISFIGDDLYSYGTQIARFVQTPGNIVALISSARWSVTTSKHQRLARCAVSVPYFTVPSLHDHAENIAAYLREYNDAVSKAKRARAGRLDPISHHADMLRRYTTTFGMAMPAVDADADIAAVKAAQAAREARLNTPENCEKRARDQARRIASQAARALRIQEAAMHENNIAVAEWRRGERRYLAEARADGVMLRIRENALETSRGVRVALSAAVRVFRRAHAVRLAAAAWHETADDMLRVGPFRVNRIDADGTIHAGCHVIRWFEIELAAKIMNLI